MKFDEPHCDLCRFRIFVRTAFSRTKHSRRVHRFVPGGTGLLFLIKGSAFIPAEVRPEETLCTQVASAEHNSQSAGNVCLPGKRFLSRRGGKGFSERGWNWVPFPACSKGTRRPIESRYNLSPLAKPSGTNFGFDKVSGRNALQNGQVGTVQLLLKKGTRFVAAKAGDMPLQGYGTRRVKFGSLRPFRERAD